MEIEQKIPEQSIQNILKDPKKYRKMMLILEQTLYDLGYHESARMLQNQSGICYYTQQLKMIKQNLDRNDFEGAIAVIDSLQNKNIQNHEPQTNNIDHNNTNHQKKNGKINQENINNSSKSSTKIQKSALAQTKNMIYQTYCIQKIINQDYQSAISIINQHISSQNKKQYLCQALVLGNLRLSQRDLQKQQIYQQKHRKKQQIFKFCLSQYQQIGQRQIQKVIESYSQSQGQYNKQLKNLLYLNRKFPPMKILSSQSNSTIKHSITHLKINPLLEQLIVIDESKDSQQIILFKINKKNWKYQKQISQTGHLSLKLKYPIFQLISKKSIQFTFKNKKQSIEAVAWNQNKDFPLIAISSFSVIQLVNKNLEVVKKIQAQNKIHKFLHLQFNSFSDLLYVCGYFEYMNVYDTAGQQIMSIYPYPKMRKFLFYNINCNQIIGISLVTNKVYKHSIEQQVLLKQKQLDDGIAPMDICISQDQKYISVSSLQFIYIFQPKNLQILGKTASPTNPNKLIIQIKFYGDFLISLCKTFAAYQLSKDKMSEQQNSVIITKIKQWCGQGTFSIHNQFMISGLKELNCWEEGNLQCQMGDDSEFQEEFDDQIVDIENEDDQILSQSEDDSMEYDDSMDAEDEEDVEIM